MSIPPPASSPDASARNASLNSVRSGRLSLSIGSHISIDRERGLLTCLSVLFACMCLTSFGLSAEALYFWHKWHGYQLIAVLCFSPVAILASVVSFWGSLKSVHDLSDKEQLVIKVKGVVGEDILLFGLYLSLFAFAGCAILGTCCLFYQEQIQLILTAQFSDPDVAKLIYSGASIDQVAAGLHSAYVLSGYLCFIYAGLGLVAFLTLLSLSLDHETTHSILQVENLVLLCLGLLVVLTAGFSLKARTDFDWEEIPVSVLEVAIALGVAAGLLALYGYFVSRWEVQMHISLYVLCCVLLIGVSSYFLKVQFQHSAGIQQDLSDSCMDTMSLVDGRYLQHLGCTHKYVKVASAASQLSCPKEVIRRIWESDPPQYGCLNPDCCGSLVASTKIVMDYIGVAILCTAILCLLALVSACVLSAKVSQKGQSLFHGGDSIVLFTMLIVLVLGAGVIYAVIPFTPIPKPDLEPQIVVRSASLIDPRLLSEGTCVRAPLITVHQSMFHCVSCDKVTLQANTSAELGSISYSEVSGVNSTATAATSVSMESKDPESLSKAIQSIVFCSTCPGSGGSLTVNLTRREYGKVGHLRNLQHQNVTNVTSFELKHEEILFTKSFSMSFPSLGEQEMTGMVDYQGDGAKDVSIYVHTVNPTCFSVKTTSDPLGNFSFTAAKTPNFSTYPIIVEYSGSGFVSTTYTTKVGGLALSKSLPTLELLDVSKTLGSITVLVVDGMKNRRLGNVTVELRTGYRNETGQVLASRESNVTGGVSFDGLALGAYTITAGGTYLQDSIDITVSTNATYVRLLALTPNNLSPDQIRVVLTWQRDDLDLDLRNVFDSTPVHHCNVNYADKYCGGTKLYQISSAGLHGGETITLREVSASQYLFYVTSSRPGDFSTAEIKVYAADSRFPVFRLAAPEDPVDAGSWFAFCLNGEKGVQSVATVDLVKSGPIDSAVCTQFYGGNTLFSSKLAVGCQYHKSDGCQRVASVLPSIRDSASPELV